MINLLPSQLRENTTYARRNTVLFRWVSVLSLALVILGILVAGGYIYLNQTAKNYTADVASAEANLKAQKVDETQKAVEDISNNTKLAIQVLSREILFSKLLRQLGATLPANTSLQQLEIDKLQGGLTLQIGASDINAGTQAQVNFQDPKNKIFEKADIENINCTPPADGGAYPCTVQIRALFGKDNPYLYITKGNGS